MALSLVHKWPDKEYRGGKADEEANLKAIARISWRRYRQ